MQTNELHPDGRQGSSREAAGVCCTWWYSPFTFFVLTAPFPCDEQEHQRKNTCKKKQRRRNEQEEPLSFWQQAIAGLD